jgi:hypothetical protein
MNDNFLNDPVLQSLEARLAALPPRLSTPEREQLLYHAAFAAGQTAATRTTAHNARPWIGATAVLALLSLTLGYRALVTPSGIALEPNRPANVVQHSPLVKPLSQRSQQPRGGNWSELSASTSLERVVDFNWPAAAFASDGSSQILAGEAGETMLTSRSRILADTF